MPPNVLPSFLKEKEVEKRLYQCLKDEVPFDYVPPKWKEGDEIPSLEIYRKAMKKLDLLAYIPKKEKIYVVDEMCKAHGIELVRLPPYHCHYNTIELVWAKAKDVAAKNNITYNLTSAMELMRDAAIECDVEYWKNLSNM